MVRKPLEQDGRPLRASRYVEILGGFRALGVGDLRRPENPAPQHRAWVGPCPAARDKGRPRVSRGCTFEPAGVDVAQNNVDLEDRPASPESKPLLERREPDVSLGVDQAAARARLNQRRAAVIEVRSLGAHLRRGGLTLCVEQPGHHDLLPQPRHRLADSRHASNSAGRGVELDLDRFITDLPAPCRQTS